MGAGQERGGRCVPARGVRVEKGEVGHDGVGEQAAAHDDDVVGSAPTGETGVEGRAVGALLGVVDVVVVDQAEGFDAARGVRHEAERGFAAQVVDQSPAQACNVGCTEGFVRCQREESGHGGRIGGATEGARQTQAMFGHAHQAAMRHEEGFEIKTHVGGNGGEVLTHCPAHSVCILRSFGAAMRGEGREWGSCAPAVG